MKALPLILVFSVVALASCKPPAARSPEIPNGFKVFAGLGDDGARFLVAAPSRFVPIASRTPDECFFKTENGDSLSVAFVSRASLGMSRLRKEIRAKARAGEVTRNLDGAEIIRSVVPLSGRDHMRFAGVGFWDRAQASAAVELRSRLSQGEVAAELDQIVASIYYDPSVQTRAEIMAKFGNQVRFLDKSK